MRELAIGFLIALLFSSYMNGTKQDSQSSWFPTAQSSSGGEQSVELIDDINEGTFQGEVLDSHEPVLVEFYGPECSICQQMKPDMAKLAEESNGFLKIYKVDAKANQVLAERYEIINLPGFVLFNKGKVVNATSGKFTKQELENWIKKELDMPLSANSEPVSTEPTQTK